MLDFCVKTRIRFSLRDKPLFEITEVETTRVDYKFVPETSFQLVQIGVGGRSLSKVGIEIKCHKCYIMKYGHHSLQIHCTTLGNFVAGIFTPKKVN